MLLLSILLLGSATAENNLHPLSDEFIEHINTKQNLWKAGRNYPENTSLEHLSGLLGAFLDGLRDGIPIKIHRPEVIASLPETFDAREKWLNCPSLKEIRDQGGCGSCWALGAVEAMTDRWCIHSGKQFHFSAQDLGGCEPLSHGCHGGDPVNAWKFWNTDGIVSGGNYSSNQGCRPYEIQWCNHGNINPNCSNSGHLNCVHKCMDSYEFSYQQDKKFGSEPYLVKGEDHIKAELYLNGPLEVAFKACPDIFSYRSGVYKTIYGPNDKRCEGHAVKLLGWGLENGSKYWLLANSWNEHWGEIGGYFKYLRGENHMQIEDHVVGALPKY